MLRSILTTDDSKEGQNHAIGHGTAPKEERGEGSSPLLTSII